MSPKVLIPGLVQLGAGAALVIGGIIAPDDALRSLGLGAIAAGLTTLGVGYQVRDPKRR